MTLREAARAYGDFLIGRRVAARYLWALDKAEGLKRMQRVGEDFLGKEGAREVVANIGFSLLNFDDDDPEELVTKSVNRLLKLNGQKGAPIIPEDVDVRKCAKAMARAWELFTKTASTVVYHGSPQALEEVVPDPSGVRTMNGLGIWLTSDPEAAKWYGENIHEVRLPSGKFFPAKGDDLEKVVFDPELAKQFKIKGKWPGNRNEVLFNVPYLIAWRDKMKKAGYVGIAWKNSYIDRDLDSGEGSHDIYLVFTDRLPARRQ